MITPEQQELIHFCKCTGYGWAKFASSVEASGRCSDSQHSALVRMVSRIKAHRDGKKHRYYGSSPPWSRSGDYSGDVYPGSVYYDDAMNMEYF